MRQHETKSGKIILSNYEVDTEVLKKITFSPAIAILSQIICIFVPASAPSATMLSVGMR